MIEIKNLTKKFDDVLALNDLTCTIRNGEVFGLIGTNGAGKSTLLRLLSGVYRQDSGTILVDGQEVYENPAVKEKICFIPDSWSTPVNADIGMMEHVFCILYPRFSRERFDTLVQKIGLDRKRKLRTFSKGMQRQAAVLLGVCANTKYLLCDEVFDGLDPVMRQNVKKLFATEMLDRDFTPVIASHNLRELEELCDHVGLLHRGGILLSANLDDMRCNTQKVQCVFRDQSKEERLLAALDVVRHEKRGSMLTIVARGTRAEIMDRINALNPIFAEVLPLNLEEIFISETEVAGYDFKDLIQ